MRIIRQQQMCGQGLIETVRIVNSHGASASFCNVGAGIVGIEVPDKDGCFSDVVLGYANLTDYFHDTPCAGKTPGRFANRIAKGNFSIDGKAYQLDTNNGPNALHGGQNGFHSVLWQTEPLSDGVRFTYHSKDGEEGYPGNLVAHVEYHWNDQCELTIFYEADTDAPTIVNLTNHAYFNLDGEGTGTCLDQTLQLFCHTWLPTDDTDIPLGDVAPVDGTPMDFTCPKTLGRHLLADFGNLRHGKGYNHFFPVDGWKDDETLRQIAILNSEKSGRTLEVSTTQYGAMLYTGNWLDGSPVGKSGRPYRDYDGVAIECQGAPDAPNHARFPSQILRPGDIYRHIIVYRFF